MRKLIFGVVLGFLGTFCHADATTTRAGIVKPSISSTGWGTKTNSNWDIVDASMCVQSQSNTFSSSNTFQSTMAIGGAQQFRFYDATTHYIGFRGSNTVTTTNFIWPTSDGTIGQLLETDGSGNLSWTAQAGVGATPLGVSQSSVSVSSPTSALNFIGPPFSLSLVSGNTAQITLDVSSVTLRGNVFNQASKLVQLDSASRLPAVDASLLTNISISTVAMTVSTLTVTSSATINSLATISTTTVTGTFTISGTGYAGSSSNIMQIVPASNLFNFNGLGGLGLGKASPVSSGKIDTVGSVNSDTNVTAPYFFNNNSATPAIAIKSGGSNSGLIENDATGVWSLAYGASKTSLGTPVLKWSSTGTIITAGNINISSGMLAGSNAGTNGQVLTSGGAGTVPTWTTISGSTGRLVQSSCTARNDQTLTTSSAYSDVTGMTITITPLSASSTLYIRVDGYLFANGATVGTVELFDGSNVSIVPGAVPNAAIEGNASVAVASQSGFEMPYNYNSVSALTVKLRMASSNNSSNVVWDHNNNIQSFMCIKEIQ